ncbi:uncharacterized protein MONOS_6446 [Monocercomonoides exilis]|uniref:uncharacterized protein n=1 Tax=Monocercomonoides exilis TaxID=2049356 RepID=UPI00355954D8|nr:hypothetical protein MONOS_6446 [Monocercomonoides exilis]|eukprot:MONOS_6446.1-p1 / transcript=MONOS_6446.1 / gene=MONOS_6446 / organism=Monocercomonoides_exilis_PA203 / gene_product=unspecified product / transcript_product=unspecified product / location=Mono_scaffold00202:92865-93973(+) / protein_length=335 / sequence_SO=supercontig / SO=protein_coding / is_pseudo=false
MERFVAMRCSREYLKPSSNRSTGEAALREERLAWEGKREEAGRARIAGQVRGEGMDRYVGEENDPKQIESRVELSLAGQSAGEKREEDTARDPSRREKREDCREGGARSRHVAALACGKAGVLFDKYLVGAVECIEEEDVDVEVCVGEVNLADGGVSSERMLSEAEGKERLVDLGGDGGASEKEVLSREGVVQDKAEVEDAFGQVQLRFLAVEEHHCNSALRRLFAHATNKHKHNPLIILRIQPKPTKPAGANGQIATRELQGSQEEETERDSSLAEVDAEKDMIRMKRRGFSGSETHTLLPLPQSFMKKVFVESAWKKSSATKGEEHQVRISG